MIQRNILFFVFLSMALPVCSQLNDNFSDGNFTSEPVWGGTPELFKINTKSQLQSAGTGAESSYLSTPVVLDLEQNQTVWAFYIKLSFNPSDLNYARSYLLSDNQNLTQPLNGYYLQIGNAKDQFCLYRSDHGVPTLLINGEDARMSGTVNAFYVKVIRSEDGIWSLSVKGIEDLDYSTEGTATDTTYQSGGWFGFSCTYTQSRKTSFYMDDISIEQGGNEPDDPDDPIIPDVPDEKEDSLGSLYGKVIFNELMVNPSGVIGLPEIEYIELYNRCDISVNLQGWSLFYGEKGYPIPASVIPAKSYLILTKESNRSLLTDSDWPIVFCSSFPTLLNTGKLLYLLDQSGELIQCLEYSDKWYGSTKKKAGGYSLECIDSDNMGNQPSNWIGSIDSSGGTPGRKNSVAAVLVDTITPHISKATLLLDDELELSFSKPMCYSSLVNGSHYSIDSSNYQIIELYPNYPQQTTMSVKLNIPLTSDKETVITIDSLRDLSGLLVPVTHLVATSDTVFVTEEKIGGGGEVASHEMLWLEQNYLLPSSPDREGRINVFYSFPGEGWSVQLTIYNMQGLVVNRIETGTLSAVEGSFIWNGNTTTGKEVVPGIYLFYAECVHPSGEVKRYKMSVIVGS